MLDSERCEETLFGGYTRCEREAGHTGMHGDYASDIIWGNMQRFGEMARGAMQINDQLWERAIASLDNGA